MHLPHFICELIVLTTFGSYHLPHNAWEQSALVHKRNNLLCDFILIFTCKPVYSIRYEYNTVGVIVLKCGKFIRHLVLGDLPENCVSVSIVLNIFVSFLRVEPCRFYKSDW